MSTLTANPMFSPLVTLILGIGLWFGLTDSSLDEKKKILSVFIDSILYFVILLFGINILIHFSEIMEVPYRVLLFSSSVVWLATIGLGVYEGVKYGTSLWNQPEKTKSAALLLSSIGLVNHLYVYFLYSSTYTLRFVGLFALTLLLLSFKPIRHEKRALVCLLLFGLMHVILMGDRTIIYFNFAFSPVQLLTVFLVTTGLIMYQRRKRLSQQK